MILKCSTSSLHCSSWVSITLIMLNTYYRHIHISCRPHLSKIVLCNSVAGPFVNPALTFSKGFSLADPQTRQCADIGGAVLNAKSFGPSRGATLWPRGGSVKHATWLKNIVVSNAAGNQCFMMSHSSIMMLWSNVTVKSAPWEWYLQAPDGTVEMNLSRRAVCGCYLQVDGQSLQW